MSKCIVCNSLTSQTKDLDVTYCKNCRHFTYTPSIEIDKTLNHPVISESLKKIRTKQAAFIRKKLENSLEKDLETIEIGAGMGYLITEFKKVFHKSSALDVDTSFKDKLEEDQIIFIEKDIDEIETFSGYDLVLGSHVIEHLKNPNQIVQIAKDSEVKNLIFLLPINEGFIFKCANLLMKLNIPVFWNRLFQKMSNSPHYQYFSNKSINYLFEKNGYKVVTKLKINMADFTPNFKRIKSTEGLFVSIISGLVLPVLETINYLTKRSDGSVYYCKKID